MAVEDEPRGFVVACGICKEDTFVVWEDPGPIPARAYAVCKPCRPYNPFDREDSRTTDITDEDVRLLSGI